MDGAVLQAVQSSSAALSMVACLMMSARIWREKDSSLAHRMLSCLFVIDFILAIMYAVGRAGQTNYGFCQFQVLCSRSSCRLILLL